MTETLQLEINGMTCGSCSKSITTRLSKFEFLDNIDIQHETNSGSVVIKEDFDSNKEKVITAISQLGYEVKAK